MLSSYIPRIGRGLAIGTAGTLLSLLIAGNTAYADEPKGQPVSQPTRNSQFPDSYYPIIKGIIGEPAGPVKLIYRR